MPTLHIDLDLTVTEGVDPIVIADAVLEVLWAAEESELPGVESIDGAEPIRARD